MRPINVQIGKQLLELDLDRISIMKSDILRRKAAEILFDHTDTGRALKLRKEYPLLDITETAEDGTQTTRQQTNDEWAAYIGEILLERMKKRDDESQEAYEARIFEQNMEDSPTRVAFEVILMVCDLFGMSKPSKEDFFCSPETSETAVLDFVFELLYKHDSKAAERFRVRRPEEETNSGLVS